MRGDLNPQAAYPLIAQTMADDDAADPLVGQLPMKRGDVIVVEFPYADGGRGKNRPARSSFRTNATITGWPTRSWP